MAYTYEVSPQQYLKSDDVSRFPAGMRNNNPGNLKFSGSKWQREHYAGMLGPSVNKDEGSPQIVFSSPQKGAEAMARLLSIKGNGGLDTVNKLITSPNGWTPGNYGAAANVAKSLGIGPDDRIDFRDPSRLAALQRALITQEHGSAGSAYHGLVDDAVKSVLGGAPVQASTPAAAAPAAAGAAAAGAAPAGASPAGGSAAGGSAADIAAIGSIGPAPTGMSFDELGAEVGFTPDVAAPQPETAPAAQPVAEGPAIPQTVGAYDFAGGDPRANWQEQSIGRNAYADKMNSLQNVKRGLLAEDEAINTADMATEMLRRRGTRTVRGLLG